RLTAGPDPNAFPSHPRIGSDGFPVGAERPKVGSTGGRDPHLSWTLRAVQPGLLAAPICLYALARTSADRAIWADGPDGRDRRPVGGLSERHAARGAAGRRSHLWSVNDPASRGNPGYYA